MKRNFLKIVLVLAAIAQFSFMQEACAAKKKADADPGYMDANPRDLERAIAADRDKIIAESKVIAADKRKMKNSLKLADKTEAERTKREMEQDIKNREANIKALKKSISDNKDHKNDVVYGRDRVIPKRTAGE